MGLYFGSKKYKLHIGSSPFMLAIKNIINGIMIKSSDNFIIKTSDDLYLTVKEGK